MVKVMSTPDIVLHQWCISPFCLKVQKILDFKRLPYRIEEYGGLRGLTPKGMSSVGKLPVLDYGAERLQDSSVIAAFLDERHPSPPLVPPSLDPHLVHLLEDWTDESLYWFTIYLRFFDPAALDKAAAAACQGRPAYERILFKQGMHRYKRWVIAQGLGRYPRDAVMTMFRKHLGALEGRLTQHPWLVGDAPCIADISAAAMLEQVVRNDNVTAELEALPKLWMWLKRCQFPSTQQIVANSSVLTRRQACMLRLP
jgi:glutathione S-transferase